MAAPDPTPVVISWLGSNFVIGDRAYRIASMESDLGPNPDITVRFTPVKET